jgi:hypothetical protein
MDRIADVELKAAQRVTSNKKYYFSIVTNKRSSTHSIMFSYQVFFLYNTATLGNLEAGWLVLSP